MWKGCIAIREGSWEEFKEGFREKENSSEWTLQKIREANEKVAREEVGRLGLVQEILRKSTDFSRRIIAPVGGRGGVSLSARIATVSPWRTTSGGYGPDTETATTGRKG